MSKHKKPYPPKKKKKKSKSTLGFQRVTVDRSHKIKISNSELLSCQTRGCNNGKEEGNIYCRVCSDLRQRVLAMRREIKANGAVGWGYPALRGCVEE